MERRKERGIPMFATQIPRHGNCALASFQRNILHNAARTAARALPLAALALLSVVFCSAAAAQTAHFSWTQTTLAGGLGAPYGVAVDSHGNVYVSEMSGSLVQEIVAVNGVIPASPTINPLGGGFSGPWGVAVDASGNVYVADSGHSAVKEIPSGCITSACVETLGTGFLVPTGVAVDGNGNVFVADNGNHKVKEIPLGCISTPCMRTLGSGFSSPTSVAVDSSGNVYVADPGLGKVEEIFAVAGSIPASPIILSVEDFIDPEGIAVDSGGNVYVVDAIYNASYEIQAGVSQPIQLGSAFNGPEGVAVDSSGRVYVANNYGESVIEVAQSAGNFGAFNVGDSSGTITVGFTFDTGGKMMPADVLAGGVSESDFVDAGTGSCTTNGLNHTYVANEVCTMDVYFTPSTWGPRYGAVELRDAGGDVMAIGYVYGTGIAPLATFAVPYQSSAAGGFKNPTGLAMDGFGDIFVADVANNAVKEIESSGTSTVVSTANGTYAVAIDGGGNLFVAGDVGTATISRYMEIGGYTSTMPLANGFTFNYISGLAVDGNGNVFVADYFGGAIYEITAADDYGTVKPLHTGSVTPYGVAVDVNGNVFFTDASHGSVDEIPAPGYSTVKVLNSTFNVPWGIALDGNGNIFVADFGGNSLKEIMASGGYTTVNTLADNVLGIQAVVLDPGGKVYYSVNAGANVTRLDYTAWPDMDFPATALGSTSSTQTVTMNNTGNQWLYFLAVGYPEHFPETFAAIDECYTGGFVAAGGSCAVTVAFAPRALGSLGGAVMLVDNSLYPEWGAYQKIDVFGTSLHTQSIGFTDSLPSSANYSAGLSYTLSANGGGSGNPVTFSLVSGPATLAGSKLTITGAGTVVIAADQAGNTTYAAAPEATQSITIKIASQTINFPSIVGTQYAGTQITLSATASSGLAVTFTSQTPSVCTVAGTTASLLTQGTCIIRATQAGSATWAPAVFVQQNVTVHLTSQTITFPAITATQYILGQLPLSATASSGLAVSFASATSSVCTVAGTTASLINLGTCVIHATQAGNSAYTPAPLVSQSFVVHINPQTISFPTITGTQYAATQLTLSATATSGLPVSFASTTPTICTVASGKASLLIAGTCILQATQAGNADYSPATLVQQNVVVHLAPQTINFPNIASQIVGANVTLSATASSNLTVSFASATGTVCSVSGTTATMLTAGTCVFHATQAGNATYSAAPLVSQSFKVTAH